MSINPRKYRHKIKVFKKKETTVNTMNEVTPVDQLHCERFARRLTQGAREIVAANQAQGERSDRWVTPSDDKTRAITPKMTLQNNGDTYEIVGTWDMDGLRREVVIDCKRLL